jgi:hypothetical protein
VNIDDVVCYETSETHADLNQDLFIVVLNGKHRNSNYCENLRKSFKSELLILNYDNRLWAHPQSNNEA